MFSAVLYAIRVTRIKLSDVSDCKTFLNGLFDTGQTCQKQNDAFLVSFRFS